MVATACLNAGTQFYNLRAGLIVYCCRYNNKTQVHRYTGTQVHRYTGTQVHTQIKPVKIVCESSSKPENFNKALFSPSKKSFSLDS